MYMSITLSSNVMEKMGCPIVCVILFKKCLYGYDKMIKVIDEVLPVSIIWNTAGIWCDCFFQVSSSCIEIEILREFNWNGREKILIEFVKEILWE